MTIEQITIGRAYTISHSLLGCFTATFEGIRNEEGASNYVFTVHMDGEEYLINALLIDQYFISPYIYN